LWQRLLWNARSFDDLLMLHRFLADSSRLEGLVDLMLVGDQALLREKDGKLTDTEGRLNGLETAQANAVVSERVARKAMEDFEAGHADRAKARIARYRESLAKARDRELELIKVEEAEKQARDLKNISPNVSADEFMKIMQSSGTDSKERMQQYEQAFRTLSDAVSVATSKNEEAQAALKEGLEETFARKWADFRTALARTPLDGSHPEMLDFISKKIPELIQSAAKEFGHDEEELMKKLDEIYDSVASDWLKAAREIILKAANDKEAFGLLGQEVLRFFRIFPENYRILYPYSFNLANQFFKDLIYGAKDEILTAEQKLARLKLADQIRQNVERLIQENKKPSDLDEEIFARYLQTLFWYGENDPVVWDFIQKNLTLDATTFAAILENAKQIHPESGKYLAKLKDRKFNYTDLFNHAKTLADLKFEQMIQFKKNGTVWLSTGARATGAETLGEKDFVNLAHWHPSEDAIMPSLEDPNKDAVLQVDDGGAAYIFTPLGITKYYRHEEIKADQFDLEAKKDILYEGKPMSYEEMHQLGVEEAKNGKTFTFDHVDSDDPSIKIRVEFKPWRTIAYGMEEAERDDFMPFAQPVLDENEKRILSGRPTLEEAGTRSEMRLAPVLTEREAYEQQIRQWYPQDEERVKLLAGVISRLRSTQSKKDRETTLLEAAKQIAQQSGIEGQYGELFVQGGKEVPIFIDDPQHDKNLTTEYGYANIEKGNMNVVVNRDKFNGFAKHGFQENVGLRQSEVKELEALLKNLAIHLAHELAHIQRPFPGDPATSERYAWQVTAEAMRRIDGKGFSTQIELIEGLINLAKNKHTVQYQAIGELAEKILLGTSNKGLLHLQDLITKINYRIAAVGEKAYSQYQSVEGVEKVLKPELELSQMIDNFRKVTTDEHIVLILDEKDKDKINDILRQKKFGGLVKFVGLSYETPDPEKHIQIARIAGFMGRDQFEKMLRSESTGSAGTDLSFRLDSQLMNAVLGTVSAQLQERALKVAA